MTEYKTQANIEKTGQGPIGNIFNQSLQSNIFMDGAYGKMDITYPKTERVFNEKLIERMNKTGISSSNTLCGSLGINMIENLSLPNSNSYLLTQEQMKNYSMKKWIDDIYGQLGRNTATAATA